MKLLKCIILLMLTLASLAGTAQTPLSVEAFDQKLAGAPQGQLLDVRTPAEYVQGHLPRSSNFDFRDPVFVQKIATLDKDKPVFVYCLSGGRSGQAAKLLAQNGFKEVYDMQGGTLNGQRPVCLPRKTRVPRKFRQE
ncbi:rhodanese-like domain-containing protein [Salmonirosea aquatica]|uniref:Rhodanese-like domain-containing protein n=1 Tax=Salmonirosea aquatica TaxID=2654236 RepID=A0A7C9FS37_9BACT|nr:rhodanese-like domain-containing protein [Cytophagaceae bacterium SJW1-29]